MPRQARGLFLAVALLMAGASVVRADIAPPRRLPPQPQPLPPQPKPEQVLKPTQPSAPCKAVPIYSIDNAHIVHGTDATTITAGGTASTAGWHDAELSFVSVDHSNEADSTATYQFVACPPEVGAEVMSPVTATLTLVLPLANFRYVVIKAQTNDQMLDLHAPFPGP